MLNSDDIHFAVEQLLKRPVAFYPIFSQIGGSVTAGIMLSQLWYWSNGRGWNEEGWIWKTSYEWAKETTLSPSEIEGARKKILARGLVKYKRAGLPAKPHYQLNKQAILEAVVALQNSCLAKSVNQAEPYSKNKFDEKQGAGLPKRALCDL